MYAYDDQEFVKEMERVNEKKKCLKSYFIRSKNMGYDGAKITTADCKQLIKDAGLDGEWKRVWKKQYAKNEYGICTYRVFENENRCVTILHDGWGRRLAVYDFDLRIYKDKIESYINKLQKTVVGMDGGTLIEYNPFNDNIFISMSDCGFVIMDDANKIKTMSEEDREELFYDEEADAWFLYGDEFSPEIEMGYIPVGYILDALDYE